MKTNATVRTPGINTTSLALRKHQKQVLSLAMDAIDRIPTEERHSHSMTLPIDRDKIKSAKARIEQFALELVKELSMGTRDRVYQLNISLFPLTKGNTEKELKHD